MLDWDCDGKSNLPSGKASPQATVSQGHIPIVRDHKWTQGSQRIRWSEKLGNLPVTTTETGYSQ